MACGLSKTRICSSSAVYISSNTPAIQFSSDTHRRPSRSAVLSRGQARCEAAAANMLGSVDTVFRDATSNVMYSNNAVPSQMKVQNVSPGFTNEELEKRRMRFRKLMREMSAEVAAGKPEWVHSAIAAELASRPHHQGDGL